MMRKKIISYGISVAIAVAVWVGWMVVSKVMGEHYYKEAERVHYAREKFEVYRKAAWFGHAMSQYRIGELYYTSGVTGNRESEDAAEWYRKAARKGLPEAQYALARLLYMGEGVEKDVEEAQYYFKKASDQGYAPAQTIVGGTFLSGEWGEKNPEEAVRLLQLAARGGDAYARYLVAYCYYNGLGVERNFDESYTQAKIAAAAGEYWAEALLGDLYMTDEWEKKNYQEAVDWYQTAERHSRIVINEYVTPRLTEAYFKLAEAYRTGNGVEANQKKAMEAYQRAGNRGSADALYRLGLYYREEGEPYKAYQMFEKVVEVGDKAAPYYSDALYSIGDHFATKATLQDMQKAVEAYEKSAKLGNVKAQLALAKCYEEGTGVPRDLAQAEEWYQKAAQQNNVSDAGALCTLADRYLMEENLEKAFETYRAAAEQDYGKAQIGLAKCYFFGTGTTKDREQAEAWISKAEKKKVEACLALGDWYAEVGDPVAARKWYEKESETGNIKGKESLVGLLEKTSENKQELGKLYLEIGKYYHDKKSWYDASNHFLKAINYGNAEAEYYLGVYLFDGRNGRFEHNVEKAVGYFKRSAQKGCADAQYNLAECYLRGYGMQCNTPEAITWYKKAAAQGHVEANYMMGEFSTDRNTVADWETAAKYYERAANGGHGTAKICAANINSEMGSRYENGTHPFPKDYNEAYWHYSASSRFNRNSSVEDAKRRVLRLKTSRF